MACSVIKLVFELIREIAGLFYCEQLLICKLTMGIRSHKPLFRVVMKFQWYGLYPIPAIIIVHPQSLILSLATSNGVFKQGWFKTKQKQNERNYYK